MAGIGKIIGSIFSGSGAIRDIFAGVDQLVTSEEEKIKLKNLLQTNLKDLEQQAQAEITKRHASDMASDSWLSKNVRPMTLVFLLVSYFFLAVSDGNIGQFQVQDMYVNLLGQMMNLAFVFYFGSRGAEKIAQIVKRKRPE